MRVRLRGARSMRLTLRGAEKIREHVSTEKLDQLYEESMAATDAMVEHINKGGQLRGEVYDRWKATAGAFREEAQRVAVERGILTEKDLAEWGL